MCVIVSEANAGTSRVGIRALRQNLSVYLRPSVLFHKKGNAIPLPGQDLCGSYDM